MRAEKKFISAEYLNRLKSSPFFLVVDYRGLSVGQFTDLRKRLVKVGGEVHVVKNTIFRVAAKEAGIADLTGALSGQVAVVTGQEDIAASAKVIKGFQTEFDKPKIQFGYMGSQALSAAEVRAIADLPSLLQLRGKIAALINTPATQLARVIKANVDKTTGEPAA